MNALMRRYFIRSHVVAGAAVLALATPAAVLAQDQPLELADPAQTQSPPRVTTAPPGDGYWASIGGYEVDSHDTGFGFFGPQYVRPIRDNLAFVGSGNVNFLHYQFANAFGGRTEVRSPGVTAMGGLMFGQRNWFLVQAGPSFKRRHLQSTDTAGTEIVSDRDWHMGFNLAASAWVDPTDHNNIFAMYNYETVDQYHWGRLAFKEQIGNRGFQGDWTPYLGAEYIGQGNQDIMSNQFGGFIELAHNPSSVSVMFRSGWKRSAFEFGPDQTGPWFAVGFYHRLR